MYLYYWGDAFTPQRFWDCLVTAKEIEGVARREATKTEMHRAKEYGENPYCLGNVSDRFFEGGN